MKWFISLIAVLMGTFFTIPTFAQDVPTIEYNKPLSYTFKEENEQLFAQFTGKKGDIIYVEAEYEGFVIGTLEIDLRDKLGRSIGLKDDYIFKPYILAELPSDGDYTVVVTSEKAELANVLVGKTNYLNSEATTIKIAADAQPVIIGINAEKSGKYAISIVRTDGELATEFSISRQDQFIDETIVRVSGGQLSAWTGEIELKTGEKYIAILTQDLFRKANSKATIEIKLTPITKK